tara:strand:+ start:78 stop:572 length:495 start_codon:yes stop_codon:yes gene_type:complete
MINTDKYNIDDDVVWVWNENLDENYDMIKNSPKPSGWVLWEYKECPAEKGGYILMDGRESDKTYEPWEQILPALEFQCKTDEKMQAIVDLPLILKDYKDKCKDVKRLQNTVDYIKELILRAKPNEESRRTDFVSASIMEAICTKEEYIALGFPVRPNLEQRDDY